MRIFIKISPTSKSWRVINNLWLYNILNSDRGSEWTTIHWPGVTPHDHMEQFHGTNIGKRWFLASKLYFNFLFEARIILEDIIHKNLLRNN